MMEVIKKAIRNGWNGDYSTDVIAKGDNRIAIKSAMGLINRGTIAPLYSIIFNHEFAKAYFTPDEPGTEWKGGEREKRWKEHLKQMVIEKDPVEYLAKFL